MSLKGNSMHNAILFSVSLVIGALVTSEFTQPEPAAQATWCGAGTTGRATQSWPPTGAHCRLSQCRGVGYATGKVQPCDSGNPNCIGGSGLIAYTATVGTWMELAACPTWTATSTWNAPK